MHAEDGAAGEGEGHPQSQDCPRDEDNLVAPTTNDAEPEAGESNARRWVVYEVPPEFIQAGQAAAGRSGARRSGKGGSKKGKAKRAPKSEL